MENLRTKKILSECSLYLGHGDHINSAEKVDDDSTKHTSNSPTENGSANVLFSRPPSTSKTAPAEDHPVPLGNATYLTPNKGEAEAKLNGDKTPGQVTPSIDFSALTPADFGITLESFTRKQMKESKSLLKKFRRRSTIGVRGSPENNSLICYIARQKRTRMEEPSSLASPFKHHSMLLKDKMAAFQSSFKPLEETEEKHIQTHSTSKEGGPGPQEQSTLGQGWHLECQSFAVENYLDNPSMNRERTSAELPVCNMVSPLQEPLSPGTAIVSKAAVPVLKPDTAGSQRLAVEAPPVTDVPKTACGIQPRCIGEELSSSAASQQSCKKVRFAEKESLEIFDTSKPPVTPLQKGQFPSSVLYHDGACLRSVLKKPPERFDDSSSREGIEAPLAFETCGSLQIGSYTRLVNETEEDGKDLDAKVLATPPLVGTPLLRGVGPCSPSGSRNYSTITPIKQHLSQPNFDNEDDLPPGSSEAVPTTECAVNSDLEEIKDSSPDLQATCCRITRSSLKRKKVSKQLVVRSAEPDIHLPTEMQSKRASSSKVPKPSKVKKANSKKTSASRHKVFGKRKRKKKEQKALYGQRETVSKKPLLSPIPEMKEDLSFASYRSTPMSQISTLDYSDSSDSCVEYMDERARKENSALQNPIVDRSGLNLSLDLVKEDALVSSQLQDAATTAGENAFPWDPPEKNSPEKWKSSINTNQQVLKSDCSSNETEMQKEPKLLSGEMTGQKKAGRGESGLAGDSALEQKSEGEVNVNLKRFPRRSRRLARYLPNIDDDQSETPGDGFCVPRSPLEELLAAPQTVNDSVLLNDLRYSIEESFRGVSNNNPKRVRRSMRRLKDAENSGLAWIHVPAENFTSQAVLGCASKAQRQMCPSGPEELECLSQKQVSFSKARSFQMLLPATEEQENAPVALGPCRSKAGGRRKSISALSLDANRNAVLPRQRNRRASLGYRSDQGYRKDSENSWQINQPINLGCCLVKGLYPG